LSGANQVIQTETDYNRGVFNGDLGIIEKINRIEQLMIVNFEGRQASQSQQPLVPSHLVNFGGEGNGQSPNMLGALLSILAAEKVGAEVKPSKKH
jgi:hypothetical protein